MDHIEFYLRYLLKRVLLVTFVFILLGGLPMYVATRRLLRLPPPTIIVPTVIKESVEKPLEAHTLTGLDVGVFSINKVNGVYICKGRVSLERGCESKSISDLPQHSKPDSPPYSHKDALETRFPLSNIKITCTTTAPEIAFTGDTISDFIVDDANSDVLKAKILIMEVIEDALICMAASFGWPSFYPY